MRNGYASHVPFDDTKVPASPEAREKLAELIRSGREIVSANGEEIVVKTVVLA